MPFGIGDFIASFKGDTPGHPFRGNQYDGGNSGLEEDKAPASSSWRDLPPGHPDRTRLMKQELEDLKKRNRHLQDMKRSGIGKFIGGNKRDFKDEDEN